MIFNIIFSTWRQYSHLKSTVNIVQEVNQIIESGTVEIRNYAEYAFLSKTFSETFIWLVHCNGRAQQLLLVYCLFRRNDCKDVIWERKKPNIYKIFAFIFITFPYQLQFQMTPMEHNPCTKYESFTAIFWTHRNSCQNDRWSTLPSFDCCSHDNTSELKWENDTKRGGPIWADGFYGWRLIPLCYQGPVSRKSRYLSGPKAMF